MVSKYECDSLSRRQGLERGADLARELSGSHHLLRQGNGAGTVAQLRAAFDFLFIRFRRRALFAPAIVETNIHQNPIEPRVKARSTVELIDIRIRLQKGVLREVFRLFPVAGKVEGD